MNILIVDDEMIIRQWFAMTIEKIGEDYVVRGEASNGEEALKLCRNYPVDLVVTDIKMPMMDGISLMKELKSEFPSVKIVVLSSYNDFHFAVEAMKYGASDYILKPEVTVEQLKQILQKIQNELELERKQIFEESSLKAVFHENWYALREIYIKELLEGNGNALLTFDKKLKQLDILLDRKNIILLAFAVQHDRSDKVKSMGKQLFEFSVVNITDEILKNELQNGCCIKYEEQVFVTLFNLQENSYKTYREALMLLFYNLGKALKRFLDIDIYGGVSTAYGHLEDISKKLQEASEILKLKLFYKESSLGIFGEQEGEKSNYEEEKSSQYIIRLADFLEAKQYDTIMDLIGEYLDCTTNSRFFTVTKVKKICLEMAYLLIAELRKAGVSDQEIGEIWGQPHLRTQELSSFSDLKHWFYTSGNITIACMKNKDIKYCSSIQTACEYIRSHFHQEIRLEKVSEYVHLNRSYFCELFKKETGMGFNDYVTRVRMEKAKKLLKTSDMPIVQIAEFVGYSNAGYFNRVFKRFTGRTPGEYKE